ncbi:sodium:solute symporter family protein [Methylotuvimicrobium sp. KM2]|uniref:sodium:solute symporter family protein n=1 Tax=Methylotuvimicrobium sp. KM2 TaxID=3133976 RepID=UPI0031010902
MNTVLTGILVYISAQLLIGVFVSKKIKTEDDYLLAGRSLGLGLATLSVFATWFGAETCIGAAGAVYEEGLSGATLDPFGYSLCLILMGLVFSIPLWRRQLTTLADLFRQRYSPRVEKLAVLMMVPGTVMWAAAQIRAFGQVLSATSGFEVELTVACAALVVIVYTMYGGLMADVITDAVQGVALIIGLSILLAIALTAGGGWQPSIASIETERLALFKTAENENWLDILERWMIPIGGSVIAQELISRVLACRSPQIARQACLAGGLLYLSVGLIPVLIGLLGYRLLPGLEHPEQILPQLAQHYLPAFLYIVFAGALISAILSTVDSALMAASALLSHNLIVPLLGTIDENRKVRIARLTVLFGGMAAYWLALQTDRVHSLVEQASAFGSAGIVTVVVFGLFTRFGGAYSAAGSLLAGTVLWNAGNYAFDMQTPYLIALCGAIAVYSAIAILEPKLHKITHL